MTKRIVIPDVYEEAVALCWRLGTDWNRIETLVLTDSRYSATYRDGMRIEGPINARPLHHAIEEEQQR